MNIINWLKSCSGEFSISATKAIGAAAALGVAGIAAYQMFSSPDVNPDTVFSSQDNDVVYVAGANGGAYNGVGYGEGGEVQSGIRVSSRNIQLNEKMEQEDLIRASAKPQQTQLESDEQEIQRFKMDGQSTGLGMNQDAVKLNNGGAGDMSGVQSQIAAISAMADQKKAEAQAQAEAAGAAGDIAAAAQAAALRQDGGKGWSNKAQGMATSMHKDITRSSATNPNSLAFGGSRIDAAGAAQGKGQEADRLAMANRPASFASSRDEFDKARAGKYGNDLAGLTKQSADLMNKNNSANAGGAIFLAEATKQPGIQVDDDASLSLGGASSSDMADSAASALGNFLDNLGVEAANYEEEKAKLIEELYEFSNWAGGFSFLSILGWLIESGRYDEMNKKIDAFEEKFKDTEQETAGTQDSFASIARNTAKEIFWSMAFPTGPWMAYYNNKRQYFNDCEDCGPKQ